MSNYKLKNHTAVYDPVLDMYNIFDGCGGRMGTVTLDLLIDFGWEKVEEPFKEGEWYHYTSGGRQYLFRYVKKESYCIEVDGTLFMDNSEEVVSFQPNTEFAKRATPEQVERILSIVARHKGYKEGVKIISIHNWHIGKQFQLTHCEFVYDVKKDSLYYGGHEIYSKETWAKIVEEPKAAEPEVEAGHEYLCIKDNKVPKGVLFSKGKRYVFQVEDGGKWFKGTDNNGSPHGLSKGAMKEYFDMGTDWKTAKLFSNNDILCWDEMTFGGRVYRVIPQDVLEEEAKKRSNQ